MPKKRHTIEDVRAAGYEVGLASGSVTVEEEALAAAQGLAAPEAVAVDVEQVVRDIMQATLGLDMPKETRAKVIADAAAQALESIQGARNETVAFHEQALAVAKEMPDVYFVSALGDPDTPDDDVQLYVSCKPNGTGWDEGAQEILNSLCAASK